MQYFRGPIKEYIQEKLNEIKKQFLIAKPIQSNREPLLITNEIKKDIYVMNLLTNRLILVGGKTYINLKKNGIVFSEEKEISPLDKDKQNEVENKFTYKAFVAFFTNRFGFYNSMIIFSIMFYLSLFLMSIFISFFQSLTIVAIVILTTKQGITYLYKYKFISNEVILYDKKNQ